MTDNPLVSIIIPVYNAEKYLRQSIDSAINQTWPNIEVIIIDDGSTDSSLGICCSYKCNFLKVFTQNNQGASCARNLGLSHAIGKYIQFLDADDYISIDKIEQQVISLRDAPEHLALCDTVYFDEHEEPENRLVIPKGYMRGSDDPKDFLMKLYGGELIQPGFGGMIQPNAWLTPKIIIDKAGWWNTEITLDDDGEFFCRVILASAGIKFTHEGKNYYRKYKNGTNLSSLNSSSKMESLFNSWMLKRKHLIDSTKDSRLNKVLARNFTELYFIYYNKHKQLREKAYIISLAHGGLTHLPYFGNRHLNKLKLLIGWKFCFLLQRIYSSSVLK